MEPSSRRGVLFCVAVAVLLPALATLWQGDRDLNFSDEGYLWYGVQRTAAGEVPLRDFQAYHPGRYWFCAAFVPLFGDGILGVRRASAVIEGLGLLCALLVTRRVARGPLWTAVFGLFFALWAFPRHKLFESAFASMAAWSGVRLLERPSLARHLALGTFVGLAGCFGSNLGLYAGLASVGLVALAAWNQASERWPRVGAWAGGVVLGFAPFLALLVAVPGFARGFADSVRMVLEHGANIPRPWPWPWRVATSAAAGRLAWRDWTESCAFLVPVVALPALLWALLRGRKALGAHAACHAPSVVGLVFLHHVSINSGAWHLAQCLQPLLLALIALPELLPLGRVLARVLVWAPLALVTLAFTLAWNPLLSETAGARLVPHTVGSETLQLFPGQAQYLSAVERVVQKHVGAERLFLAPNMPALYCALGRRSPSWWLYFYFPMSDPEQDELVRSLDRDADWALLADPPPAPGREKSFRKTHPLVWAHFERVWQRVQAPGLPADLALFRRAP